MRTALAVPPRLGFALASALAMALLIGSLGRWREWLGVWSSTQQSTGVALIIGIPVAAALGAWTGAAARRSGLDELVAGAGRSEIRVTVRELGETVCWGIFGYFLGAVPPLVATAMSATYGRPDLLAALAQVGSLSAAIVGGQLVGRRLPRLLGAPICAVVAYVVLGLLSFETEPLLLALTPIDSRSMTFHHVLWWVLAGQVLFWLLVLVSLVARRAGRSAWALSMAILAGVAAAPMLTVTPETLEITPGAEAISCTRGGATVCFPVVKQTAVAAVERETAAAVGLLDGLLPRPVAVVDDEAAGVSPAADRELERTIKGLRGQGRGVLLMSELGGIGSYTRLDRNQFHGYLVQTAVPLPIVRFAGSGKAIATPANVIQRWYLRAVGVPVDGTGGPGVPDLSGAGWDYTGHGDQTTAFEEMRPAQRARWFREHAQAVTAGTVTWRDLGAAPD